MKSVLVCIFLGITFGDINPLGYGNLSCGVDNSRTSMVYEGTADIETYPWLGVLYYPIEHKKITTAVILITKQIVIGYAMEIDKLPKEDVRARSRVVLGHDCGGPSIRIRDYTFHPDYKSNSYSALAIVQLEIDQLGLELRPICPPPTYFIEPEFYAMTPGECHKGKIKIYKMIHVSEDSCKQFYRRSRLDLSRYWPSHTVCARAKTGGRCKWRSGTALVFKQGDRWKLLGFGMGGPGCDSPSRFLDYGKQEQWVINSITRIGQPAITRLAPNHVIMRRTMANVQRFGPCDIEEMEYELYTDRVEIITDEARTTRTTYNLTLVSKTEYSCIIFKLEKANLEENEEQPKLVIRRWCAGPPQICYDYQYLDILFNVEFMFSNSAIFSIAAYGKTPKTIDVVKTMSYINTFKKHPFVDQYDYLLLGKLRYIDPSRDHKWFYKQDLRRK